MIMKELVRSLSFYAVGVASLLTYCNKIQQDPNRYWAHCPGTKAYADSVAGAKLYENNKDFLTKYARQCALADRGQGKRSPSVERAMLWGEAVKELHGINPGLGLVRSTYEQDGTTFESFAIIGPDGTVSPPPSHTPK